MEVIEENLAAAPKFTVAQAREIIKTEYPDSDPFYPGELNKLDDDGVLLYGFAFYDGDVDLYAYVNSMTGALEVVDEIEDYTGEGAEG